MKKMKGLWRTVTDYNFARCTQDLIPMTKQDILEMFKIAKSKGMYIMDVYDQQGNNIAHYSADSGIKMYI